MLFILRKLYSLGFDIEPNYSIVLLDEDGSKLLLYSPPSFYADIVFYDCSLVFYFYNIVICYYNSGIF